MSHPSGSQYLQGLKDCLPILLAVSFFGMLFGATGVSNGLTLGQTLLSSASVFAGASQFVFLDLYNQKVPVWSILLAVFAVNFRHVLYSASIGRYMGYFSAPAKYVAFFFLSDPSFGAGEKRVETQPLKPSYYFGFAASIYPIWLVSTLVGALSGNLITNPESIGDGHASVSLFSCLADGIPYTPKLVEQCARKRSSSSICIYCLRITLAYHGGCADGSNTCSTYRETGGCRR